MGLDDPWDDMDHDMGLDDPDDAAVQEEHRENVVIFTECLRWAPLCALGFQTGPNFCWETRGRPGRKPRRRPCASQGDESASGPRRRGRRHPCDRAPGEPCDDRASKPPALRHKWGRRTPRRVSPKVHYSKRRRLRRLLTLFDNRRPVPELRRAAGCLLFERAPFSSRAGRWTISKGEGVVNPFLL